VNRAQRETESTPGVVVRRCEARDLPGAAKLAARLVREHHRMDPDRFFIPDRIEEGYQAYLHGELSNPRSVVLVAAQGKGILGYAYGRIEPRDWNSLRERCGVLHDVYVDAQARNQGIATRLIETLVSNLRALGAPRIVLMTASRNTDAQKLFGDLGFRETMIEMTRECPDGGSPAGPSEQEPV
jgi:ribosomal protein S18 acetylase RimI-like enzyme